jgi:hypothetical protein
MPIEVPDKRKELQMKSASSSALSLRIRSTIVGLGVTPVPIVMSRRTCVHLIAQSAKLWRNLVASQPEFRGTSSPWTPARGEEADRWPRAKSASRAAAAASCGCMRPFCSASLRGAPGRGARR